MLDIIEIIREIKREAQEAMADSDPSDTNYTYYQGKLAACNEILEKLNF